MPNSGGGGAALACRDLLGLGARTTGPNEAAVHRGRWPAVPVAPPAEGRLAPSAAYRPRRPAPVRPYQPRRRAPRPDFSARGGLTCRVIAYAALPEPEHRRPPLLLEPPGDMQVLTQVTLDPASPALARPLFLPAALVAVPKVAVAEHGDLPAPASKVGTASHLRVRLEPGARPSL